MGLRFTLEVSVQTLHLPESSVQRLSAALDSVGIPRRWGHLVDDTVLDRIGLDKKKQGTSVRVIGLRDLGDPVIMTIPLSEFKDRLVALATLDAKDEHQEGE